MFLPTRVGVATLATPPAPLQTSICRSFRRQGYLRQTIDAETPTHGVPAD